MSNTSRNLSLRGLRTFCVAAEHESFRDAAEKLFVTASAVSHQIKNLEDELGKKLFERGRRTLTLTDAGNALYSDVHPLISQLDDVTSQHRNAVNRSTLSISVQPFFASEVFVPRLPEFRDKHPDIDIMIDTSDESVEKHPGKADVSIRIFKSAPASLSAERLFTLRLVPAASRAFRNQLKIKAKTIVSDFPVIVHQTRPKAWQQWQRVSGIELPANTTTLRLDSMTAVARAAERGLGAALVPVQLSDSWFESGGLVQLFSQELTTSDAYYFVCRAEDTVKDNVRALRHWVLQSFGDLD
ncbi:MAG: LysR substrate-binding domain-containing protein [Gammaproteobacteria bacterium]|nr:LysR substrate-binding domain-containing protein [Gammaproteobacteria bacterium]